MSEQSKPLTAAQRDILKKMADGIVEPGTERGDALGFTADLFVAGFSYLWVKGPDVYVSAVAVYQPGKGAFSRLVRGLLEKGYAVKVPTPLGRMSAILQHMGFEQGTEYDENVGESVDVWTKRPASAEGCQAGSQKS